MSSNSDREAKDCQSQGLLQDGRDILSSPTNHLNQEGDNTVPAAVQPARALMMIWNYCWVYLSGLG